MRRARYPRPRKSDWPGETGYDYYIVRGSNSKSIWIAEDTFGDKLQGRSEYKFPHPYRSGRAADKDAMLLAKKYGYKYTPLAEHERKDRLRKEEWKKEWAKMTPAEKREYRRESMLD